MFQIFYDLVPLEHLSYCQRLLTVIFISNCYSNLFSLVFLSLLKFIGGKKILQVYHGKDVTKVMESGVHSHSINAFRWLEQYYIADYANESIQNGLVSE